MKIGFIGCGNMATAIIKGIIRNHIFEADEIIVSDVSENAVRNMKEQLSISGSMDNKKTAAESEVLVLSVKPQYYETVIAEIKDIISQEQIIVTIAPGKTLQWISDCFGKAVKLVRTMPNTPALIGEGMTGVCRNDLVEDTEYDYILRILRSFGKAESIPESLMDVCVSVSGSAPAYVYILIEAMADGAVADGMPRAQAYKFAAQAVLGSAKMVLETEKHPGELKDMVCSPGGTTMEAVRVLEEKGFRSSVIEAMKACVRKARGL